jgi:hypothetical protein
VARKLRWDPAQEQFTGDDQPEPAKRRSWGWLCWVVIAVAFIILLVT